MGKLYFGDELIGGGAGGGGVNFVNALPTADETEYNKHLLYQKDRDLYYLSEKPIFKDTPTETNEQIDNFNYTVYDGSCALIGDVFYFFGGNTKSIQKLNIKTKECETLSTELERNISKGIIAIPYKNYIYVIGGLYYQNAYYYSTTIRKFDTTTETLTTLTNTIPINFNNANQNYYWKLHKYNDKWYMIPLYNSNDAEYNTIYTFDFSTESVIATNLKFTNAYSTGSYNSAVGFGNKIMRSYGTGNSYEILDIEYGTSITKTSSISFDSKTIFSVNNIIYSFENFVLFVVNIGTSTITRTEIARNYTSGINNYEAYYTDNFIAYGFKSPNIYELSFENGLGYVYKQINSKEV